jgi:hypothetical protein
MSRIILVCFLAALLAASGTRSANAIQGADQDASTRHNLACAGVGIDPGSAAFSQCVADLRHSLWALQNQRLV